MFEEYRAEVYAEYIKSRKFNIVLADPKPSSLRDEAQVLLKNNREGCEVLRLFSDDGTQHGKLDIDKFKPVQKFLLGQTSEPNNRVVELVAWLIDFKPRPFEKWRNNLLEIPLDEEIENGKEKADKINKRINWGKVGIVATMVLFFLGVVFYPRYMTWKGDRYEWLIFNTKNANVVAIDWDLVRDFRMVTRKDTLTEHSIGKLWYLKENNDHDVFTKGGKHPVLVNRNLRPLSKTILDSIQHKQKQLRSLVAQ